MFAFLDARMSSMISSAVLSSFHKPAKLFVHPFSAELSETEWATELLNNVINSSFTLLLRSFSSDQYFLPIGDVGSKVTMLILVFFCFCCKDTTNKRNKQIKTDKLQIA